MKSSLLKLPDEALANLHAWLDDPEITQVEATERLNELLTELGLDEKLTNKSSVGRYAKSRNEEIERAAENMRLRIEEREYWAAQFPEDDVDEAGRQISSMLYASLGQIASLQLSIKEMDPKEIGFHASTIKTLASASKDLESILSENRKRVEAIKQQAREEAQLEAAETMKKVATQSGVSDDVAAAMYRAITEEMSN